MSICGLFPLLLYKDQRRCFLKIEENETWLQTNTCKYEHFTPVNPHRGPSE